MAEDRSFPNDLFDEEFRAKFLRKLEDGEPDSMAALSWFLRFYRKMKPEVLLALISTGVRSDRPSSPQSMKQYRVWLEEYGLPKTTMMGMIARNTVASCEGMGLHESADLRWCFELPFFDEQGSPPPFGYVKFRNAWFPGEETAKQAKQRIEEEFKMMLDGHYRYWLKVDAASSNLVRFAKAQRRMWKSLKWLAWYQSDESCSYAKIAQQYKVSKDTVRNRINKAVDLIELSRDRLRRSPGGRPRGT